MNENDLPTADQILSEVAWLSGWGHTGVDLDGSEVSGNEVYLEGSHKGQRFVATVRVIDVDFE